MSLWSPCQRRLSGSRLSRQMPSRVPCPWSVSPSQVVRIDLCFKQGDVHENIMLLVHSNPNLIRKHCLYLPCLSIFSPANKLSFFLNPLEYKRTPLPAYAKSHTACFTRISLSSCSTLWLWVSSPCYKWVNWHLEEVIWLGSPSLWMTYLVCEPRASISQNCS